MARKGWAAAKFDDLDEKNTFAAVKKLPKPKAADPDFRVTYEVTFPDGGPPFQMDNGTYVIYDHATSNNIVGAVYIKTATAGGVTTYHEYILQKSGCNYPFQPSSSGGTVRWRHYADTHADAAAFKTYVTTTKGWFDASQATEHYETHVPGSAWQWV
jgi:hypothetical protein